MIKLNNTIVFIMLFVEEGHSLDECDIAGCL